MNEIQLRLALFSLPLETLKQVFLEYEPHYSLHTLNKMPSIMLAQYIYDRLPRNQIGNVIEICPNGCHKVTI